MTDVGDLHADLLEGYFMFSFCNGRVTLCIFVVPIVYDGDWILYQVSIKEQMPFVTVRIYRIDLCISMPRKNKHGGSVRDI